MSAYGSRRSPHLDVWCRRCARASRFGQWVSGSDTCPFCGASGAHRRPWLALRLLRPDLPLHPQNGQVYSVSAAPPPSAPAKDGSHPGAGTP